MIENMMFVRDILGQIALANESLLLSDVDGFAVQELTERLKAVHDMTIAIQQKKLTSDEFFGQWLKSTVQLQRNNASSLALAMLHAMDQFCYLTVFLAAIYVDPRYQVLLKIFSKNLSTSLFGTIVEALANSAGVR